MSDTNNTTKLKGNQYHHLTYEDRCKIEILVNQKDSNGKRLFNNSYIAKAIGVDRSTISRELELAKLLINLIMLLMLIMIISLKEVYQKVNIF